MEKRNLKEDMEFLKEIQSFELEVQAAELYEVACYWIPKLTELNHRLVKVDEWSGQYLVNDAYRPIAEALIEKYQELGHIIPSTILFVDNTTGTGTTLDRRKNAQIGKIPGKWQEIIQQLTGRKFYYCMELFKKNICEMSQEQIIALIYHELRHIGSDGDLRHHDIEEWAEVIERLGVDWDTTKRSLPDLLDDDVDWDSIQARGLFPEIRLERVK